MAKRINPIFDVSQDMPQLIELSISKIEPNPNQPRKTFSETELAKLVDSIGRVGLLSPIVVVKTDNPETFTLAAGQRRLRAYEKLAKSTIPAIIATGDPVELAMIENIQRVDPNPIEMADAFAGMIDRFNYTHDQIAEIISKPRTTITEWLLLNELPDEIKEECRALDINKTLLVALVRTDDADERQRLWIDIKAGTVTTREAQRRQREGASPPPTDVPKELRPVVRAIETTRRVHDTLKKIRASTLAGHADKLEELRSLHRQIGNLITKLTKDSQTATEAPDLEKEPAAAEA
jgi:ParB family transcriptional regulator, chromosome partitioning protein